MDDPSNFFDKKAQKLTKQRKFEEALRFSDKAEKIRKEENSPDFWYKKGLHLVEIGEFEKAIDCLDMDISKRQKSFETFFAKGKILFQLERYDEALECFNKAAEDRNQEYLHSRKKAKNLIKAKKFEKALLYDDKASNEVPLDAEFWYFKGISFLKLKKYDDAHSCILNALELDGNNAKFFYELAKCELFLGNETRGIDTLKKSIAQNPQTKDRLQNDEDFKSLLSKNQFRSMTYL